MRGTRRSPTVLQKGRAKKAIRSSGGTHYGKLNATSSQRCSQCAVSSGSHEHWLWLVWGLKRRRYLFLHARIGRFVCHRMRLTILTYVEYVFFCFLPCSASVFPTTTLFVRTTSLRECSNETHCDCMRETCCWQSPVTCLCLSS